MPRHVGVSLALILGVAAALNTAPLSAQEDLGCNEAEEVSGVDLDCESDFTEGLTVTAASEAGLPYRFYDVQFNEVGAYIPERFNAEAMVVKVLAGAFAFRVQGPGVVVDPQGQPLETLTASIPIGPGENPNEAGVDPNDTGIRRTYDPAGDYPCDVNLPDGRTVCLLRETDFGQGDSFVRLDPGDTVYLPSNSTCFVCNTDQTEAPNGDMRAELLIWSSTTGFNGDLEIAASVNETRATPTMQGSSRFVGWMFNPGSRCN